MTEQEARDIAYRMMIDNEWPIGSAVEHGKICKQVTDAILAAISRGQNDGLEEAARVAALWKYAEADAMDDPGEGIAAAIRTLMTADARAAISALNWPEMQAVVEAARALSGGYAYMNSDNWNALIDAISALDAKAAADSEGR